MLTMAKLRAAVRVDRGRTTPRAGRAAAAVRRAERPRPPRSAVAGEPPTSPGPAGRRAAVGTAGPTRPDRPGRPARPAGGTARVREDDHARAVGRGRGSPVGLGEARRDGQRPGHDGHRHRGRGLRRPGSRRAVVGPGPGCGGPAGRGGRRARDGAGRGRARRAGAGRPAHDPAQRGTEGRRGSGGRVAGRVGDRGRQPVAAADAARPAAAQPGSAAGVRAGRLRVRVGRVPPTCCASSASTCPPPRSGRSSRTPRGGRRGSTWPACRSPRSRSRSKPPGRSPAAAATSWTTSSKRY